MRLSQILINRNENGINAFALCRALITIEISTGVTSIGEGAFSTTAFASITWPAGVTVIADRMFSNNPNLRSIIIPEGVTSIGGGAFQRTALTNVTLPSTIKEIHFVAFARIPSLTTVIIPDIVTSISFPNRSNIVNNAFIESNSVTPDSQAALRKVGYTGSF